MYYGPIASRPFGVVGFQAQPLGSTRATGTDPVMAQNVPDRGQSLWWYRSGTPQRPTDVLLVHERIQKGDASTQQPHHPPWSRSATERGNKSLGAPTPPPPHQKAVGPVNGATRCHE